MTYRYRRRSRLRSSELQETSSKSTLTTGLIISGVNILVLVYFVVRWFQLNDVHKVLNTVRYNDEYFWDKPPIAYVPPSAARIATFKSFNGMVHTMYVIQMFVNFVLGGLFLGCLAKDKSETFSILIIIAGVIFMLLGFVCLERTKGWLKLSFRSAWFGMFRGKLVSICDPWVLFWYAFVCVIFTSIAASGLLVWDNGDEEPEET